MAGFSFLKFFHFCYCKLLTFREFCGIILVRLIGGKKNMISRHKIYLKSGIVKTNVRIVDPYRPGPGLPPKQRQVKNFGYAEDYEDQEAFWKMVQEEDENFKASKKKISVDLDPAETLRDSKRWMLGHSYLNAIYDFLELDKFCEGIDTRAKYSLDEVFRFLVCQRITDPDSLRASFQKSEFIYGRRERIEYHQILRALDLISENSEALQDHLNRIIEKKIGRRTEYLFYDTTNFYFESDYAREGHLPQAGVSKEHRTEPIVQYGLFMDSNRLPVRMMTFPGNTADSVTYLPMIREIRGRHGYGRLISVADKGMNSKDNISYIHFAGDGYVFSQILRGKKGQRYHEKMFEEDKFTWNEDRTFKYRIFDEDFEYVKKNDDGSIAAKETAKRRVLIYWKKSIADREAHKRAVKLEKAIRYAGNNAYSLKHDASEYVEETHIDSETGVVADRTIKTVNLEKAEEDAKFDGFFCIVTSELDYGREKIQGVYGELEKIEESFRICKSNLNERPMFVWTDSHIQAHLTVCFVSLMIVRLLELKMGKDFPSVERVQRALNGFGCEEISKGIFRLSVSGSQIEYASNEGNVTTTLSERNETVEDLLKIQKHFGTEFPYANVKQENLNKYLKGIRFAITKSK